MYDAIAAKVAIRIISPIVTFSSINDIARLMIIILSGIDCKITAKMGMLSI
jgi:hypothetical protein